MPVTEEIRIILSGASPAKWSPSLEEKIEAFLLAARLPSAVKLMFNNRLPEFLEHPERLLEIWQYFTPAQTLAILEIIFGGQQDPISLDTETALVDAFNAAQKWMANRD